VTCSYNRTSLFRDPIHSLHPLDDLLDTSLLIINAETSGGARLLYSVGGLFEFFKPASTNQRMTA
jgi:hypothetical protein